MTAAEIHKHNLEFYGDNSCFMVNQIIPNLKLDWADKQVMRWAYGQDGEEKNYELYSDGETLVADLFLGGAIKSPAGVVHDYINRAPGHVTPDGKEWTRQESNNLYKRIAKAIGYGWWTRNRRWLALTFTRRWWRKIDGTN